MKLSILGLLNLLVLVPTRLSVATPLQDRAARIKQSIVPPKGWRKHSSPPQDSRIELRIGLSQPNIDALENHLLQTSDPDHERYGQHLSKEEVEGFVAPHEQSLELVNDWLGSYGIGEQDVSRTPAQDWVILSVPLSLAEDMLDTIYHVWQHDDGDFLVRTTSYSLPGHLHDHIDLIQPTTMFARLSRMKSTLHLSEGKVVESMIDSKPSHSSARITDPSSGVSVDASCRKMITIRCLQQLYNAVGYKPAATSKNSIAVTGYLEQYANKRDLKTFYEDQRLDPSDAHFKVVLVNGGQNNQTPEAAGDEANLDVQYAFGLAHPTPGTFYSTAGKPPFNPDLGSPTDTNEPYAKWLDYILSHSHEDLPLTISTSYGDHEQTVPEDYARRTCSRLMELGARGVTLTFSSGDGGVGEDDEQACMTNDGRNETRFLPTFPTSCPYVTSVGGTQGIPERAVAFSGGGFSNYVGFFFPKPLILPPAHYRTLLSGRGYPDVAAQGANFRIFIGGGASLISGTSASSPAFAGIVALLNDARLHQGLPSLGFLNPLLYKKGSEAFNDITQGHNPGCGTAGFNASKGWDPVTGLGTPNFGKLKKLILERKD